MSGNQEEGIQRAGTLISRTVRNPSLFRPPSLEYFCYSSRNRLRQLPLPECKSHEGRDLVLFLLPRTVPGSQEALSITCWTNTRNGWACDSFMPRVQLSFCPSTLETSSLPVACSEQQWFSTLPSFLYLLERYKQECVFTVRRKIVSVKKNSPPTHQFISIPLESWCGSSCA